MSTLSLNALDRARRKAYIRLIPILFTCYVIAYVDRTNVSIAALTMRTDLPAFNNDVIGTGAGVFFIGYFILEIPGTLLVERWSARKWICRIMITWGIVAALTSLVKRPEHFYTARFFLGLAEAGFFPGVIVYLTHWFPIRDRARALSWFLIGTPVAQIISPKICNLMIKFGTTEMIKGHLVSHPLVWGMKGWQWIYIAWGVPAVLMGFYVLLYLVDRPGQARWLKPDEREALEAELEREKALCKTARHMTVVQGLQHPKVLLLAAAYFFVVTGNYGVEIFLPSILRDWYDPSYDRLTWVLMIPPIGGLLGQLFIGWNSDRTREYQLHTAIPIFFGAMALALTLHKGYPLWVMIALFTLASLCLKAYLPAFWSLPSLFLTESAAAASIGLINSVGNIGGWLGPKALGWIETKVGSFRPGIAFLCLSMVASSVIVMALGLRTKSKDHVSPDNVIGQADAVIEPA
jgi:ACS family tartrate transporter-like MFS transporter